MTSAAEVLLVLVALAGAALALLCWLAPALRVRLYVRLLRCTTYRLTVRHADRVPAAGGVLLVANPVTYLDCLFLLAACPRRLRLVVLSGWARRGWAGRLLRWAGALTPAPGGTARDVVAVLRAARAALARGEAVCVCADELVTPAGVRLPFERVYRALTRRGVPVVPVALDQTWGTVHEFVGDSVRRKPPAFGPAPVWAAFGSALPAGTPAAQVLDAVREVSAESAVTRSATLLAVHRRFVRWAARQPFAPCLFDSSNPKKPLTYGKALAAALCLRDRLKAALGDAPMVGVWLPPGIGGVLSNLTLALLGKTSVNLNYTTSEEGVCSALRQCDVRHVLTARRFTSRLPLDPGPDVELIYLDDLLPEITTRERLVNFLKVLLLPGWLLDRHLGLHHHAIDDAATVIFSSGSTGEPKGVVLTHRNVVANIESMVQETTLNRRDRALGVLPFFHSFGYTVTLWAPLQVGASTVYHADPRQAKEIGELCRRYGCTIYLTTPTFLRFCGKKCEPNDFRTVRLLMCGAEKLPTALAQDFLDRFGVEPLEGYGCSELAPAVCANLPDLTAFGWTHGLGRRGSVGRPFAGVAARIVDPETFAPLPFGEEGMVLMYGANVMRGYLHRPDLTARALRDGWYVTGDIGRFDADGYLTLTGRLARFAKIGGEMVPLERIEEELHAALQTCERLVAVTSVPDEKRGERVVVLHLPLPLPPRMLCKALSERGLPNLWVPGERDFVEVGQLPVLGTGKLDLKTVKELALARATAGARCAAG